MSKIIESYISRIPIRDFHYAPDGDLREHKRVTIDAMRGMVGKATKESRDFAEQEESEYKVLAEYVDNINNELEKRFNDKPLKEVYIAGKKGTGDVMEKSVLYYEGRNEVGPQEHRDLLTKQGSKGGYYQGTFVKLLGPNFQIKGLYAYCPVFESPEGFDVVRLPSMVESDWSTNGPYSLSFAFTAEGSQISSSDLTAKYVQYEPQILAALTKASQKWWGQTVNASDIVAGALNQNLDWKLSQQIYSGNGVSSFTGITETGSRIDVTRTTTSRILWDDIINMKRRLFPYSKNPASIIWICSPDSFSQILDLEDGSGGNIFVGQNSANQQPYRLLGHEVVILDAASSLGSAGDLALCDMSWYQICRFGQPRLEVSRDVYFDYDLLGIKLVFLCDGRPLVAEPITMGTTTYSPFIVLA